jgi:hypothetical protein
MKQHNYELNFSIYFLVIHIIPNNEIPVSLSSLFK